MAENRYLSKHTGRRIDTKIDEVDAKQDRLVSGENIKKINGLDLLGSGSLSVVVGILYNNKNYSGVIELNPEQLKITEQGNRQILEIIDASGTNNVEGNPAEDPTEVLTTIRINDTIYSIPGSEGQSDRTIYRYDDETTAIFCNFEQHVDQTFAATATVVTVRLITTETMYQGFQSCITFVSGPTPPHCTVVNNTTYPLKMVQYGRTITTYTPSANCTVTMLVFNDGINNNLLIYEAQA